MHWRAMTDKETLGAWDLVGKDGRPKDFTLEIAKVQRGLVKSREKSTGEHRPFVHFKGAPAHSAQFATLAVPERSYGDVRNVEPI